MLEPESLIEACFQFGKPFFATEGGSACDQGDLTFLFRSRDELFERLRLQRMDRGDKQ
jgi:hypothetical protein